MDFKSQSTYHIVTLSNRVFILKLLRHGKFGVEKPGILDPKGQIRDLSAVIDDITGDTLLPEKLDLLQQ